MPDGPGLDLWRLALPMPMSKTAPVPVSTTARRPLKSLRKVQARGMPLLPLSR